MGQTSRLLKNFGAASGSAMVEMALRIVTLGLLVRQIGMADYGTFSVVLAVTGAPFVFEVGLDAGARRQIGVALGRRELDRAREAFTSTLLLYAGFTTGLIAIGLTAWTFVHPWLSTPTDRSGPLWGLFLPLLLASAVTVAASPFRAALEAQESIPPVAAAKVFYAFLLLLVAGALIWLPGDDLMTYARGFLVATVAHLVMLAGLARWRAAACRLRLSSDLRGDVRNNLRIASWYAAALGAHALRSQGAIVIANICYGPIANAAYDIAMRLAHPITMLSTAVRRTLAPAMIQSFGSQDAKRLRRLTFANGKISGFVAAGIFLPLAIEAPIIMEAWLSEAPPVAAVFFWFIGLTLTISTTGASLQAMALAIDKVGVANAVTAGPQLFLLPMIAAWIFYANPPMWALPASLLLLVAVLNVAVLPPVLLHQIGATMGAWLRIVVGPLALLLASVGMVAVFLLDALPPDPWRLTVSLPLAAVVTGAWGWFLILDDPERQTLRDAIRLRLAKSAELNIPEDPNPAPNTPRRLP